MVHEETNPSFYFLAREFYVGEKYFVSFSHRDGTISKPERSRSHNVTIEVRSSVIFDIVHTV
jgi:hypothetical protein